MKCPACKTRMKFDSYIGPGKSDGVYRCENCDEMYTETALAEEEKKDKERAIDWKEEK